MENIRYDPEPASILIKKIPGVIDGEDSQPLIDSLKKNELELKILLRKIKLRLKKERGKTKEKELLAEYKKELQIYMDIIDDTSLILEGGLDLFELDDKIDQLEEVNSNLIDLDLRLQKFVVSPRDVTTRLLPGREEVPKKKKGEGKLTKPLAKAVKKEQDGYSSLEILKIGLPPRIRKKLPEIQYKKLDEKLRQAGLILPEEELKKIAECGFDQRINMSVLNRIFDTLEEVIANYGGIFRERMKTVLLFIASNYLFIYDVSKFHTNFDDPRVELMEKIIATLNTGLSITEYISSLMKVIEILQLEEHELLGEAKITENLKLPFGEWMKVNEYETNLRYEIKDYWQQWFESLEMREEFEDPDYEMVDEEAELFLEKLTFLELKIERLPYALESPWELSSWLKELFTLMKDHSSELKQWNRIKNAEIIMGTLNFSEQSFTDPNMYTIGKGENILLKLGRRVDFIKDKILGSLHDTIDNINNSWQRYRFSQPVNYFDTSTLERGLIGLTLAQTAADQISLFLEKKNMLDLVFATQLLSIANELYSLGLTRRPIILESKKTNHFIYSFINFHTGKLKQDDFLKEIEWLPGIINSLVKKRNIIKKSREKNADTNLIDFFVQKALEDYTQGQSDLEMYKQTQLRLFLLTSVYSIMQGTNRLVVLKELKEKSVPEDEYYEDLNILSELLNNLI